jgi:uncharacterized membrane protein
MYTLLLIINSILALGSSWIVWNAVAESGVRSQIVTLGKCYVVTAPLIAPPIYDRVGLDISL